MSIPTIEGEVFYKPAERAHQHLPEGTVLLQNHPADGNKVGWVAIQHGVNSVSGSLHVLDLETRVDEHVDVPGQAGFFVETDRPGIWLVGLRRELVLVDIVTGDITETGLYTKDDEETIINDGVAVSWLENGKAIAGVVFGTKHIKFSETRADIYLYKSGHKALTHLADGQVCSNGKVLVEVDGQYYLWETESIERLLVRYNFDPEEKRISDRTVICEFDAETGSPDGTRLSPDSSCAFVPLFHPGDVDEGRALLVDLQTGAVTAEWLFPGSPRVTCPAFVRLGGEVKVLVSTAVEHDDPDSFLENHPNGSAFFIAPTPFQTLPPNPLLLPYSEIPRL